jgi:hypothetical protein
MVWRSTRMTREALRFTAAVRDQSRVLLMVSFGEYFAKCQSLQVSRSYSVTYVYVTFYK